MKTTLFSLCSLVALLGFSLSLQAAAVAGAGIEVDWKYVAGYAITHTGQSNEALFRGLAHEGLTFERDYAFPKELENPNQLVLEGRIRLAASIRNRDKLAVELQSLTLVKRDGAWHVDADELEQALKKARQVK